MDPLQVLMVLLVASMCFAALQMMRKRAVQGKRWLAARIAILLAGVGAILDVALGPTALSVFWVSMLCALWLAVISITRSTPEAD